MSQQRTPREAPLHIAKPAAARPQLNDQAMFVVLERQVELEYRPQMLEALQRKVNAIEERTGESAPSCPECGRVMKYHDRRMVTWLARFGKLEAEVRRYRCGRCKKTCRPLLEVLGVEPGRISGSLARLLALLAAVAPYPLAAQLAGLLLGVEISAMGGTTKRGVSITATAVVIRVQSVMHRQ